MLKDVPPHLVRIVSVCLDQVDLADASRACQRLSDHLAERLGRQRALALLLLGLTLARADCPLLDHLGPDKDGHLPPLDAALADHPHADAHAAVVALLSRVLHLLATLEGDPAATAAARVISAGPSGQA